MDKLDFAARLAAYKKDTKREDMPYMLWQLALPVAFLVFLPYLMATAVTTVLSMLIFGGMAMGLAIASVHRTGRRRRRHGLVCPSCNHAMTDKTSSQIVMATGHCGHCGNRVLTEE